LVSTFFIAELLDFLSIVVSILLLDGTPGLEPFAASLAAATLAAAAVGFDAVVEVVVLPAVVGLEVAELLDLLRLVLCLFTLGVLELEDVGVLGVPEIVLFIPTRLDVPTVDLTAGGLGRTPEEELAFEACLETAGVDFTLVEGGRDKVDEVEEVGRLDTSDFTSDFSLPSLDLDGILLETAVRVVAVTLSDDLETRGFRSVRRFATGAGLAAFFTGSTTFSLLAATLERLDDGLEDTDEVVDGRELAFDVVDVVLLLIALLTAVAVDDPLAAAGLLLLLVLRGPGFDLTPTVPDFSLLDTVLDFINSFLSDAPFLSTDWLVDLSFS